MKTMVKNTWASTRTSPSTCKALKNKKTPTVVHVQGLLVAPVRCLGKLIIGALFILAYNPKAGAQFVHPGGLHTLTDLNRMKTQVAAGTHPWIDSWNLLIADAQAQKTYTAAAKANMGSSRQRADADAHAAYLNAIRWYVSGDTSYANCAVRILNAWSATVNQVPTGTDIPGLSGIPIFDFGMAAEVLRAYSGWSATDFTRFKTMMTTYFYPVAHDFLTNHNGACISNHWANWDICNIGAILTIGVLCDDTAKYNEAVNYFKTGAGMGSIMNAVPYLHTSTLGQWQESGRDQEHAQLGVGMMAYICQIAWNQGLDLFGYSSSRLMAGAEYVAQTNLWNDVPYSFYTNCQNANQYYVSVNGRGRLDDRPVWEILYNHYVVRQGLSAPHIQAMAQLMRPEHGSTDHFGYGSLTFTLNAASSPYPPSPVPASPTGLSATAGVGRVFLNWAPASSNTVQGYKVLRATTSGGPYTTTVASWNNNTTSSYTDATVTNGTTYYYVVAAINQAGTSGNSAQVSATPAAATSTLPSGWTRQDVGTVSVAGTATYAAVSNNTFVVSASGTGIGGTSDSFGFTCKTVTGDFMLTARIVSLGGTLGKTGIMIRESLAANARTLVVKLGDTGWRQAGFGYRTTAGGSTTWVGGNDYTWAPVWVRLQRSGNTFTGYQSSDGVTWFAIGSATVAMANTYYAGLALCSGSAAGALNTSSFDNVDFNPKPVADGVYNIVARHSGKLLDVLNNGTANGTNVRQWPSNGCTCQQWTVTNIGNGQYKIVGVASGKYLDVNGSSTVDGANVQIWQSTGGNNQRFTFTSISGGYFRITPVHSGKAVEVASNSTADGANVQQWVYNGGNNQQWAFVPVSGARLAEQAAVLEQKTDNKDGYMLFPNPVTDYLTLHLGAELGENAFVNITDIQGHTVLSLPAKTGDNSIDLRPLAGGVYLVAIVTSNKIINSKIVKY